jgi:hypothetical protein
MVAPARNTAVPAKPVAAPRAAPKAAPKAAGKAAPKAAPPKAPAPRPVEKKDSTSNGAALAPAAGRALRGEFNHAPLNPDNAVKAYGNLTGDQLAGPDDIRLQQISKVAAKENVELVRDISKTMTDNGIDANVYGRAKTPESTFGKLRETPGMRVADIKDLSGARIDINPSQPDFAEYKRAGEAVQATQGDAMHLKKDYIAEPNPKGYTGRVHHVIDGPSGVTTELQVGSKDVSKLIDSKLTTAGGDRVSVHDATFYKGDLYGARLPPHLEGEYTALMREMTDLNKTGKSLDHSPALRARYDAFMKNAEAALPPKLNAPPAPELSRAAKVGNALSKGAGALGVVGGGFQVAQGVGELRNGKPVEGAADVTIGTGNIVAGGAMVAGRVALGTTTGGAVAVLDGAKDIYVGVRDRNLEKGVVGTVKTAAGGAMLAGVATANPVLIAGGAVTYAGAAIYENREAIAEGGRRAWGWVKSWF